MEDLVIGRDVVLQEYDALHDLLHSLPSKAQLGPKTLVGQVRGLKEHGVKHLFSSLKEKALHESLDIEYTCFDVSRHVVALGVNLGMIFFFDNANKKLSRFSSESIQQPVTCIKLLPLQSFLASGHANGSVLIFSYMCSSKFLPKAEYYPVSGIHTSAVTCVEWSPDGTVLYSGDEEGKIAVTIVKVPGRMTQTALLFHENAPIVQLSYSEPALLVSTSRRTVLWDFSSEQPTQVGQKERKSPGSYGACFYPPARIPIEGETAPPLTIYAARPGLRLWAGDLNGKVLATLMYKGLMTGNPPGVRTLTPLPSSSLAAATRSEPLASTPLQFGRLENFHGQFVVTWDAHRLWVLDTSPCALVCCHHSYHGNIVDVCTVGHEVYVLQQKCTSLIKKFSLIPKLPNPLLKVRIPRKIEEKFEHEKKKNSDFLEKETQDISKEYDNLNLNFINPVPLVGDETSHEEATDLAALASKLKSVAEEDYGDIVFRPKRPNRKNQKTDSPREHEDNPDIESTTDDISDISSELDFADRSVSNPNSEDDESPRSPHVTLVTVSTEQMMRPHIKHYQSLNYKLSTTCPNMQCEGHQAPDMQCEGHQVPNMQYQGHQVPDMQCEGHQVPNMQCEGHQVPDMQCEGLQVSDMQCEEGHQVPDMQCEEGHQVPDMQCDNHSVYSVSSTETEKTMSLDSGSNTLTSISTLSESGDVVQDVSIGLDDSHSFPQIYSTTPLNISDLSFSLEKSTPRRKHPTPSTLVDSSMTLIDSMLGDKPPVDSSQETPPLCYDADGAEELGDTVSWSSSCRTFSDADNTSYDFFRGIENIHTSEVSHSSNNSSRQNIHLLVDSWSDVRSPTPGYVVSLDVSDLHIWCVTNYDSIFYCPTHYEAVTWTQLEGQAKSIAVNNAGDVIWCIDGKNNAFARRGIREGNLIGSGWVQVEKNIRCVAVDDTAVWGVYMNGDVFMRDEVSKERPEGRTGRTIAENTEFIQVSCLDGLVWFVDKKNSIHVFKGVNLERPDKDKDKENWQTIRDIRSRWACLKIYGWSWLVDTKGSLWFTDTVTHDNPTGAEWYQVSLGQYLMQNKTLLETLWSWVRRGDEAKLLTANPKAGIWILGKNGSLNSARGHLLGGHWESITPNGIARSVFWSYISARGYYSTEGKGNLWALQPSGELICFQPAVRTLAVESPSTVLKLVAASERTVWGISHNFRVVQRLGVMENLCPQGVDWKSVELSSFDVGRVCHISSGALCTWAVDESGQIWLRIGDIEKTDQTISQVWIPIEGEAALGCRFVKVAVSPDDSVVWALDDRFNVYARRDVARNFQVGTTWELVPGTIVKDICISAAHVVWAVCANGDIACRYGVTDSFPLGNYWKKVPGNFEHISVTPDGELWTINLNGELFRRKIKHFYGSQSPLKARGYSSLFNSDEEWEII